MNYQSWGSTNLSQIHASLISGSTMTLAVVRNTTPATPAIHTRRNPSNHSITQPHLARSRSGSMSSALGLPPPPGRTASSLADALSVSPGRPSRTQGQSITAARSAAMQPPIFSRVAADPPASLSVNSDGPIIYTPVQPTGGFDPLASSTPTITPIPSFTTSKPRPRMVKPQAQPEREPEYQPSFQGQQSNAVGPSDEADGNTRHDQPWHPGSALQCLLV